MRGAKGCFCQNKDKGYDEAELGQVSVLPGSKAYRAVIKVYRQ